jgi:hypothetical protein
MKTGLVVDRGWFQSGTVSKPLAEQIKSMKMKQGYEAVLVPWKMGLFVVKYRKGFRT